MATKSNKTEHLSSKQRIAVTALASGLNDTEAAKVASVNRSTLNQWKLHNVRFKQALAIESNIVREQSIKAIVERSRRLKEASYKCILEGIERGCLITARWYIERTCLVDDNKIVNEFDALPPIQEENMNSIMEGMARESVTKYFENNDVDHLERMDIENAMIKKLTARLIAELNNKELGDG